MDIPHTDDSEKVRNALLKPQGEPRVFTLSLSEFKALYRELQKDTKSMTVDIVLNGDWALVQFSDLSNHRVRVVPDNFFRFLPRLFGFHLYLEEKDLEIAATSSNFYGQRIYLTFGRFLREEIDVNGLGSLFVFLASTVVLLFLSQGSPANEILKAVNEVILGISAIFFSIFMLFTASQKLPSSEDIALFKSGMTHRFIQVDRYVAWLAILALASASLNRVLAENLGAPYTLGWQSWAITIRLADIVPITSSFGIVLIANSLLTVVRYYLQRVRYLSETELSRKLLDDAFEKRKSSNN